MKEEDKQQLQCKIIALILKVEDESTLNNVNTVINQRRQRIKEGIEENL